MKNKNKKVVSGTVICSIIGISAIGLYLVFRKRDTSFDEIGNMITNVREILHSHHINEPSLVKDLGQKIHRNQNTLSAVVDWIATGISLWKEFKN